MMMTVTKCQPIMTMMIRLATRMTIKTISVLKC
jgi:hypothetical protein